MAVVTLCAWALYANRFVVNSDAVSYLDLGDFVLSGDWRWAANGYWAPLYGILAAAAARIGRFLGAAEFPSVQALNFLILVAVLFSFRGLLRELKDALAVRSMAFDLYAYSALALALSLHAVPFITPDLAVAGVLFEAGRLCIRFATGGGLSGARLGLTLSAGYWLKSTMMPFALACLGALTVFALVKRARMRQLGPAAAVFALISAPLAGVTSARAGRPSFGENARLSYLWYVNGQPNRFWLGDERYGRPEIAPLALLARPAVYGFGGAMPATYPPWYDPSYWFRGAAPRFDARQQIAVAAVNLERIGRLFLSRAALAATLLALAAALAARSKLRGWAWPVVLFPHLAVVALLAMVHVEPRFLTASVALVLVLPVGAAFGRYGTVARTAIVAVAVLNGLIAGYKLVRLEPVGPNVEHAPDAFRRLGVAGERIGAVGGNASIACPARPAWARIIAQLPSGQVHAEDKQRVLEAFRRAGAKALLGDARDCAPLDGAAPIPGSPFWLLKL